MTKAVFSCEVGLIQVCQYPEARSKDGEIAPQTQLAKKAADVRKSLGDGIELPVVSTEVIGAILLANHHHWAGTWTCGWLNHFRNLHVVDLLGHLFTSGGTSAREDIIVSISIFQISLTMLILFHMPCTAKTLRCSVSFQLPVSFQCSN